MRRFMDSRYIPYIRVRHRKAPMRSIPVKAHYKNAMVYIRYILCLICLFLTFSNAVNKYCVEVSNIANNNVCSFVEDYIDKAIATAKKGYSEYDLIKVFKNTEGKMLSVKNDVIMANELSLTLSEEILATIKRIENKKIKMYSGSYFENGIFASLILHIPHRIVPVGKIVVTPEFTMEETDSNQVIHRLKMEASIRIKILFPFYKEEKHITKSIIVSETIISPY